ncbi:MAG TPA: hypothetical protein VFS54_08570 [Solirubrobacterales bacterium]|nr:hypothetical protein [Solirubrobacterales bacterium]
MERHRMRWEDTAVYALVLAGIYLLLGVLFFYAGKEKIIDGHGAPPPIEKQFSGTFLDTIPGVDAAWTILGLLELGIFAGATGVLIGLVLLMPPYRGPNWISDRGAER